MSNEMSLIFYLGVLGLSSLLFAYGHKRKFKLFTALAIIVPIIVGGLRVGVGTDYNTYLSIFRSIEGRSIGEYASDGPTEIGLYIIAQVAYLLHGNEILFFSIFCGIAVGFFYAALRRLKPGHEPLIYFLYLFTIYPGSFNLVRQSAAVSIVLYAYSLLKEDKKASFVLWGLVAISIHASSIFALVVIYLTDKLSRTQKNKITHGVKSFLVSIVPAIVVAILLPFTFVLLNALGMFEKYTAYETVDLSGSNYSFFLKVAIVVLLSLFFYRIVRTRQDLTFFSLATIEVVVTFLGFIAAPIKRIGMYFTPFSLMLIPKIVDFFSDRLGLFLCYSILIMYGVIFFVLSFYVLDQSNIFPYITIFSVDML